MSSGPLKGIKKFDVSSEACISCAACWSLAPDHFNSDPITAKAYVKYQPQNSEEERICEEAKALCPVEAIGNIDAHVDLTAPKGA